jgi:putative endonuclease
MTSSSLLWFEQHATVHAAITREKQIKKWQPACKIELIEAGIADWRDLALEFGFEPLQSRRLVSSGDGYPRWRERRNKR